MSRTRHMARRRLVQWPDGSYYLEDGDRSLLELADRDRHSPPLTRRERIRLLKGYIVSAVAILLFLILMGLAGASDLAH